jgi:hypothetical protein
MTEGPGAKDAPPTFTDKERAPGQDVLSGMGELERRETLAWVGEHLPQVRRSVFEQRLLYWSLGISLVVGLAVHVGGYLLKSSVTTEPLGLVADLLYALGYALWTVVVVVVSSRSSRRQNGASASRRWMRMRQRSASRPEPEATGRRGMTERRRRGSGGSQWLELAAQISAQASRVVRSALTVACSAKSSPFSKRLRSHSPYCRSKLGGFRQGRTCAWATTVTSTQRSGPGGGNGADIVIRPSTS